MGQIWRKISSTNLFWNQLLELLQLFYRFHPQKSPPPMFCLGHTMRLIRNKNEYATGNNVSLQNIWTCLHQWRGIYASCGWSSGSSITTTTYFLHSQLWQWAKLVLKKISLGQLWQNKFGNSCFCCCTWMIEFGIKRGHIMKQQNRNANQ